MRQEDREFMLLLHKENKEDIRELRKDVVNLRLAFTRWSTASKVRITILGTLGGGIFTACLWSFKYFL